MNYEEALSYIHGIPKFRRPLGNAQLEKLLAALGNPHKKMKFIHIAGTNGKGSCAAMTAEILKNAGFKTGMFTSPFIVRFNERIQINGEEIGDKELARYTERVKTAMEENEAFVSEFAFITAIAFLYFYEKKCDITVLEAGMGGRLDATNVIDKPLVSVLMSIGLDHTQYLGETISEIALEKCGIIKDNGAVVSYPNEQAEDVILTECKKHGAELIFAKEPTVYEDCFEYKGKKYSLALQGSYQPHNAAVVLEIIGVLRRMGYEISESNVTDGLANAKWQARFEYVGENVIIDGAHNPDGIAELKKSLGVLGKEVILVIAMMADKNYEECIADIVKIAKCTVATEVDTPRALKAEEIGCVIEKMGAEYKVIPDIKNALKEAVRLAGDRGVVCVCGSLYLAGAVKKILH